MNDDYIFSTTDPLDREVRLKKTTWEFHVMNEHEERKHFKGNEDFFENLVSDPDYIFTQESIGPNVRWKYSSYGNIKEEGNPKIYNIIAEDNSNHMDIVTILETSKTQLKESERKKEAKIYDRRKKNKDWRW